MHSNTRYLRLLVVLVSGLLLFSVLVVGAQDDPTSVEICQARLVEFYTRASEACLGKPDGQICNGGNAPIAEPAGPVGNSLIPVGALVPAEVVTALTSTAFAADGSNGGLIWLRVAEKQLHALLIGDVVLRDITPQGAEFTAWHSMTVRTSETEPECDAVPAGAFTVQNSVPGIVTRIVVNGISLDLLGTAMIQTRGNQTYFVALSGQIRVIAGGQSQEMVAGQQTQVAHDADDFTQAAGPPTEPQPFDINRVRDFPVQLLDRATRLPQPGYVSTEATVNLRAGPSTEYAILEQVPPGVNMTILGRNTIGDWYHVRLPRGVTGWMYAELLRRNHGVITDIYSATPTPPQRYGELGHVGRILSPSGVNMRSAPDVNFAAIFTLPEGQEVELIARSPYSPWVKVDADGIVGWVALIALDTQVIVESLPVDRQVPPQPQPLVSPPATPVPGTWGGAFPDPNCYPNCN